MCPPLQCGTILRLSVRLFTLIMLATACLIVLIFLLAPNSSHQPQNGHTITSATQINSSPQEAYKIGPSVSETSSSSLYKCELSYLQMDTSLIKFSINHLIVTNERTSSSSQPGKVIVASGDNFLLDEIAYEATLGDLRAHTKLDPSLPFIFFINGFNTLNQYGEINGTWMFDVARNLATASLLKRHATNASRHENQQDQPPLLLRLLSRFWTSSGELRRQDDFEKTERGSLRANVIFLTWGIPHLLASNLLSMIPAYYKTVANYDLILEFVSVSIGKLVEFVEHSRLLKSNNDNGLKSTSINATFQAGWSSAEERRLYYEQFEFYGHSLGSHILADAVRRVAARSTIAPTGHEQIKFGKLMGLDPATPCFLSLEYGISSSKVEQAVNQLLVVHSNAGLAGLTSERADLEIVLNGGTFQPGCAWYDFGCHHSRSTDILRYRDDQCQMVAYKCSSYHHFKTGACETCDQPPAAAINETGGRGSKNCVLVNMPEQHLDSEQLIELANSKRQRARRQLADNVVKLRGHEKSSDSINHRISTSSVISGDVQPFAREQRRLEADLRAGKAHQGFHYVNTSPFFRVGRKTHCLQHYQLRLLVGTNNEPEVQTKCRLSKFLENNSKELSLNLFYEHEPLPSRDSDGENWAQARGEVQGQQKHQKMARSSHLYRVDGFERQRRRDGGGEGAGDIQMNAIIRDLFHSALVTFEGSPRLFVGGRLISVNLNKLAACYRAANATSGPNLVLDIAFMSHTSLLVRQAFSSILCGQVQLNGGQEADGDEEADFELELTLCRQAQLQNVSQRIDQLLEQVKMHRLDDTWRVSLLNNLFSLFIEWEPF